MKGGRPPKGFTLVEVLIVLAVTGLLFVSTMVLVAGKQAQTDFDESIRDFQTQLQSLAANISNGYNNTGTNFQCNYASANTPGSGVMVSPGSVTRGQNQDCIFVGEAIQFWPQDTDRNAYRVYTLVGERQYPDGSGGARDVTSLAEAKPIALARGSSPYQNVPDSFEDRVLTGGTEVSKVTYDDGTGTQSIGVLAILTSFPSINGTTRQLQSGSLTVNLAAIGCTDVNQTQTQGVDAINTQLAGGGVGCLTPLVLNPSRGINICLKGGVPKYAVITLGGSANGNGQLTTTLKIYDAANAPAGVCT